MRFLAESLYVEKFRKINNQEFPIGNKITIFSGQNGVGKSNLISLIASTFGKSGVPRIIKGNFQPEFDDYFTMPESENFSEYNTHLKIRVNDNHIGKRQSYKNDASGKRGIRVIPRASAFFMKKNDPKHTSRKEAVIQSSYGIGTSARIPIPTLYLSLNRLFPTGETNLKVSQVRTNNTLYTGQVFSKYIDWYNKILPLSIDESTIPPVSKVKKEKTQNTTLFIKLNNATEDTQSVGQDNLSAIITALVDFFNLQESQKESYNGGLLCIDEVDASLHPAAQLRLLKLLSELSDELELQIILSTHSLTILEEFMKWSIQKPEDFVLNYIIDPESPHLVSYTDFDTLKADMFDIKQEEMPIKVYFEDEMTLFIFDRLIQTYKLITNSDFSLPLFETIPLHLGCCNLLNLPNYDEHFKKVVIIVDGDSKLEKNHGMLNNYINRPQSIKSFNSKNHEFPIISLPTYLAPESFLYYVAHSLAYNLEFKDFWNLIGKDNNNPFYTLQRVKQEISKVKISPELNNDQLKSSGIINFLKDFMYETSALKFFFSNQNNRNELNYFIKKLEETAINISKQCR